MLQKIAYVILEPRVQEENGQRWEEIKAGMKLKRGGNGETGVWASAILGLWENYLTIKPNHRFSYSEM